MRLIPSDKSAAFTLRAAKAETDSDDTDMRGNHDVVLIGINKFRK